MRLAGLLALVSAGAASAQNVDVSLFPSEVRAGWEEFLTKTGHRAFAWNGQSAFSYAWDAQSAEGAAELAVSACDEDRGVMRFLGGGGPTCLPVIVLGPEDPGP